MTTRFELGDLSIQRIVESEERFMPLQQVLPTLTPEVLEANRSWLEPDALGVDSYMRICVQSYLVRTPHHTVLIDSCVGNDKPRPKFPSWSMRSDDTYMRALAAAGLGVGDIDYVLCTHLHVDHVGWNTRLENGRWVPTFPKARYVFAEREYRYWDEQNAKEPVAPFADSVLPVMEAGQAELVRNDHQLGDHLRLLSTPGHTPDHVSIRLGRNADDAVFAGDLVHSPLQARYPELSPIFDADPLQAAATRRSFFERYCDTRTLCCTAHFPSPSAGHIKRWGEGFRCEMVSSQ